MSSESRLRLLFNCKKVIIKYKYESGRCLLSKEILLKKSYVTLGQLLKITAAIDSGGQAKWFLQENTVLVNDKPDNRRGRKLYADDKIEIPEVGTFLMRAKKG